MVQPINYMSQIPQVDLAESLTSGLRLGATFRQMQDQQIAQQQAQQAKQQFATDLQAAQADGSQKAWTGMIAKYPQFREAFGDVRKGVGEERLKNEFTQGFEISTALENNAPDVAMERVQTIIQAKRNSGEPTKIYEDIYTALQSGNVKGAQAGVNFALTALDPDRFEKSVKAVSSAAQAPSALTEAVAKADRAVADATTAQATATNAAEKAKADAAKAKADAEKAAVDAKYANKFALADLEKKAADLGLTKAQTGSALAQGRKLGAEASAAILELEALKKGVTLATPKAFEQEEKLRKEFQARTKVYGELGSTFSNIESSAKANTGPGDIALITGFMKMLDPGSVVRETEFATARDTAGLYTRLENSLKKAESGQFLQPGQRSEFVNLAKQYLDSANKKAGEDKKALGVVVKNYRLNPENVFGPETAAAPPPASPTSVRVGRETYTRPQNFTDEQWSAYKQSVGAQ
jgi:hypothetical protein